MLMSILPTVLLLSCGATEAKAMLLLTLVRLFWGMLLFFFLLLLLEHSIDSRLGKHTLEGKELGP